MPNITFPSKFCKANVNVKHGDYIRFLDTGIPPEKEGDQWTFKVGIIPKDTPGVIAETKLFGLNKTNFKSIAKQYGPNSDAWLNKEMRIAVVQVMNPREGEYGPGIALMAPGMVEQGLEEDQQEYNQG